MNGIHKTAVVETHHVAQDVIIDAYAVVGPDVVLESGVRLYPGVVIMGRVQIGADSQVFPGAVIGKPPATSITLSRHCTGGGLVRLGARSSVGAHAVICEDVSVGDDSLVGDGASIREHCRIGCRCIIGRAVSLHPDCVIGDGSRVLDHAHVATATRLGLDCFVSVGVVMVSDPSLGREAFDAARVHGAVLGDRVAVGAAAIILSGLVIGNDVTIAAGALVTRDVAAGSHLRGLPARPVVLDK